MGKKYVGLEFAMRSPNDDLLKQLNDWGYGVKVMGNLPLTDTLDLNAEIGSDWFDGGATVGTIPVEYDVDVTAFTVQLNKHLLPEGPIDPFAGIGIGYGKATVRASVNGASASGSNDDAYVRFIAGFEWKVNECFAIRPQIESSDTIEGFDVENVIDEHLFISTYFIYWCNENVFTAFGIGSDFDDTEVELRFLLGLGEW